MRARAALKRLLEVDKPKRKKADVLDDIAWSRYEKSYSKLNDQEQVKCEDVFNSVYDDEDFE